MSFFVCILLNIFLLLFSHLLTWQQESFIKFSIYKTIFTGIESFCSIIYVNKQNPEIRKSSNDPTKIQFCRVSLKMFCRDPISIQRKKQKTSNGRMIRFNMLLGNQQGLQLCWTLIKNNWYSVKYPENCGKRRMTKRFHIFAGFSL